MKRILLILLAFVALKAAASPTSINGIAAIVNDEIITSQQVNARMREMMPQIQAENKELPPESVIRDQVLQMLVRETLQLDLAKRTGIRVSPEKVNNAVKQAAQFKHQTLKQFYQTVEKQGITIAELKQQIKDQMIMQQLQQRDVASTISVSPQEVKEAMLANKKAEQQNREYRIQNILIPLPDAPTAKQIQAAKAQAMDLYQKVKQGAKFSAQALAHSKGPHALEGGDLGWRPYVEVPDVFAQTVASMKVGEVAKPIRTPNGFQLIKLAGSRAGKTPVLSREQVMEGIFKNKYQQALETWVSKLYNEAYVKIV